jgi:hypothetical protein
MAKIAEQFNAFCAMVEKSNFAEGGRVRFRQLILERRPLSCGGFVKTRIIRSFRA